jgi:amidase
MAQGTVPDLVMMDALDLSSAIRSRQVSCKEVMESFLAHIDRVNPVVNAIVSLQDRELLLRQADERDRQIARGDYLGWMHGFPHAVKDLAPTRGIRTTLGSPIFKDFVPEEDAIFVERLKKHGAIIIGKTNTPEFGLGSHTYNNVFGTTLNAYAPAKSAGGSSGGAAVSLALRMLPVSDGSDMGGSLRNPAAFNNVLGFRPSFGRVPRGPSIEVFAQQLSTDGPMGRSVADLAMLLSVMAGPDARAPLSLDGDPTLFTEPLKRGFKATRIAWLGNFGGHLPMEPGIEALCRKAFAAFEGLGCAVEEALIDFSPARIWVSWLKLRHWLVAGAYADLYQDPARRELMKPEARWEIEEGLKLTALDVYRASAERSAWYQALLTLFERYKYLLLPSAQVFPFDASTHWPREIDGVAMDTYHRWMEVAVPGTLSGSPIISVPVGFSKDGLPMGMQVIGRPRADLAVLQLAYAYEEATDLVRRNPPPLLQHTHP